MYSPYWGIAGAMGLCHCRNVTSMFCFEHRKNVCDACVLTSHPSCWVRTYLQWLQDSSWEPACSVCACKYDDDTSDLIRLPCYDLVHRQCLLALCAKGMQGKPDRLEAMKGLRCPGCRSPVLPLETPDRLVHGVRVFLAQTEWRDLVDLLLPPQMGKRAPSADRVPFQPQLNGPQPNGPSAVRIDIPASHSVQEDLFSFTDAWRTRYASDKRLSLSAVYRVLVNTVTFRNTRRLTRGVSPRQLLILLFLGAAIAGLLLIRDRYV